MLEDKDIKELLILAKKIETHLGKIAATTYDGTEDGEDPILLTSDQNNFQQMNGLGDILTLISKNVIAVVNNMDVINTSLLKFHAEFKDNASIWLYELSKRR